MDLMQIIEKPLGFSNQILKSIICKRFRLLQVEHSVRIFVFEYDFLCPPDNPPDNPLDILLENLRTIHC